jgi:hypothetical protein
MSTPTDASAAINTPGLVHLPRSAGSSTDVAAIIDSSEGGLDGGEGESEDEGGLVDASAAAAAGRLRSGSPALWD